jgi:hypothetical protein
MAEFSDDHVDPEWSFSPLPLFSSAKEPCDTLCAPPPLASHLSPAPEMYGQGPYVDRAWKACDMLIGVSPAGCTSI